MQASDGRKVFKTPNHSDERFELFSPSFRHIFLSIPIKIRFRDSKRIAMGFSEHREWLSISTQEFPRIEKSSSNTKPTILQANAPFFPVSLILINLPFLIFFQGLKHSEPLNSTPLLSSYSRLSPPSLSNALFRCISPFSFLSFRNPASPTRECSPKLVTLAKWRGKQISLRGSILVGANASGRERSERGLVN